MNLSAIAAITVAALVATAPAAAKVYDFTFTTVDSTATGHGQFTTVGAATATVTAITGSLTDTAVGSGTFTVTGLSTYAAADNVLYAAVPYVDLGGISFTTTGTTYNFGLGGSGPYGLILNRAQFNPSGYAGSAPNSVNATLNVTAVPEPAAWSLMIAGFALVGFASRRRSAIVAA